MGYAMLAAVAAVILVLNHRYGNAKSMAYRRLTDEAANAIVVAYGCSILLLLGSSRVRRSAS
jgi:hypothetical protein